MGDAIDDAGLDCNLRRCLRIHSFCETVELFHGNEGGQHAITAQFQYAQGDYRVVHVLVHFLEQHRVGLVQFGNHQLQRDIGRVLERHHQEVVVHAAMEGGVQAAGIVHMGTPAGAITGFASSSEHLRFTARDDGDTAARLVGLDQRADFVPLLQAIDLQHALQARGYRLIQRLVIVGIEHNAVVAALAQALHDRRAAFLIECRQGARVVPEHVFAALRQIGVRWKERGIARRHRLEWRAGCAFPGNRLRGCFLAGDLGEGLNLIHDVVLIDCRGRTVRR
ncbi:hypothetical protein FQZ97_858910 [compost metagenome]